MKAKITIKFHEPFFSKDEVMDYLRLERWPRNMKHRVGWQEIKPLLNSVVPKSQKLENLSYLLWTLSPEFHYSKLGLYLTDMGSKFDNMEQFKQLGKFDSEGMTNHIHLISFSESRVAQFEIGVRAIRAWIPALNQINGLKEAVVYLNDPKAYTLCVYSNPSDDNLRSLDSRLRDGSELVQKSSSQFLEWAL